MKESDFFKQLDRELQDAAPPMSDALKNEPIQTSPPANDGKTEKFPPAVRQAHPPRRRGKIATVCSAAAAVVVACAVGIAALLSGTPALPEQTYACMYIDINPSVALILDENYKVKKAVSNNADADTITGDKAFVSALVGMNAKDAAVKVAERAAKSGYISLKNKGTEETYNEISVTVKNNGEVSQSTLGGIKESLTDYFCDNGIYVYIDTRAETDPETKALTEALETRPESYFQWLSENENAEELKAFTEATVYDYGADLLTDALYKYDLYAEIESLNEQIKADPDNVFNLGYWLVNENLNESVLSLSEQMSDRLDELWLLYGVDCRERNADSLTAYTVARTKYIAAIGLADVESLRALSEAGLSEANFGGIENLSVRVNYFYFVTNDVLNDVVTEIWNAGESPTLETLTTAVGTLIEDRTKALTERYSTLFSLEREKITESAYEEFLKRIGK